MLSDKIQFLCDQRNMNLKQVETILGFGNGSLAKTNAHSEFARMEKLSNFFDVSMDFFKSTPSNAVSYTLTPEEVELVEGYRSASSDRREDMLNAARKALKKEEVEKLSSSENEVA